MAMPDQYFRHKEPMITGLTLRCKREGWVGTEQGQERGEYWDKHPLKWKWTFGSFPV